LHTYPFFDPGKTIKATIPGTTRFVEIDFLHRLEGVALNHDTTTHLLIKIFIRKREKTYLFEHGKPMECQRGKQFRRIALSAFVSETDLGDHASFLRVVIE